MNSKVINDRRILLSADHIVTRVSKWFAWGSAGVLGLMALLLVVDIVSSKLFSSPLPSSRELTEDLNVLQVFLAIGFVELESGHIRINLLDNLVRPKVHYIMKLTADIFCILMCGFLSWRVFFLLQYNLVNGNTRDASIQYPLWPMALCILIGAILLTLEYIVIFCKHALAGIKK